MPPVTTIARPQAVSGVSSMRWLLCFWLFTLLFPHFDNIPGGNTKYLLTVATTFAIPLCTRRIALFSERAVENLFFSILLLGATISLLATRAPGSILYVVVMPLSYLLYNYIRSYKLTRQQVYLLVIFIVLTCAYPRFYGGRSLMGFYNNPNQMGPLMSFVLYLLICVRRSVPVWIKVLVFLVCALFITMSNSRAGQLGFAIFVVGYVIQAVLLRKHFKFGAFLVIVFSVIGYLWMLQTKALFIIEAANDFTGSEKDADFSERDELFALYVEEVKTNVYGIGFGQSKKWAETRYRQANSPHNTYLKIVAEGGWLYGVGFVLLFIYLFYANQSIATTSFVTGYIIRGLFESTTPFTLSMTSALLLLPFYLNEFSIVQAGEELPPVKTLSPT